MIDQWKNCTKPWLWLPPNLAYALSDPYLKTVGRLSRPKIHSWKSLNWMSLHFPNPLGTSGGVDKNGDHLDAWWSFGAGFVEVGTVTPEPQTANEGTILLRDKRSLSLWNKMGFPNKGVQHLKKVLMQKARPRPTPVFVNIGKNRNTKNSDAAKDYLFCIQELIDCADAFVVNISSPNTAGLRELLLPQNLKNFLSPIVKSCQGVRPLLLKLSPDMNDEEILKTIDISYDLGVNGWVLTNTTLARSANDGWPAEGGVSGRPLASRSESILKMVHNHLLPERRKQILLVSSGGVMSPEDVFRRLNLGADLVQAYSALVFEGTRFFQNVAAKAGYEKFV